MSDKGIEFNGINVIGEQKITQTINNPAPGAETGETKTEYISARVTPSEKAALQKIKDETGFTISDIAGRQSNSTSTTIPTAPGWSNSKT